jgi:hypothetical protein
MYLIQTMLPSDDNRAAARRAAFFHGTSESWRTRTAFGLPVQFRRSSTLETAVINLEHQATPAVVEWMGFRCESGIDKRGNNSRRAISPI